MAEAEAAVPPVLPRLARAPGAVLRAGIGLQ